MEFPPLPNVLTSAPGMLAAKLLFDGLSVFCFNSTNPDDKFWQVAYPRLQQHTLQITIQRLDGSGAHVGEEEKFDVPENITSFNIRLTNGSVEHFTQFPSGGPRHPQFDRRDQQAPATKPNDLGWMVDLAGPELNHGNVKLLPGHKSRPISLANIRHSLFCNLKPEPKEVRIAPIFQAHPNSADSFSLPFNNTEIVGVLLGSAPGDILFESDPFGALNINPHQYSQDTLYEIEIRNTDIVHPIKIDPFVRGDLYRFYHVVIDVDGVEKDLWAQPEHPEFDPEGDCHGTSISLPTLDPLLTSVE